ncbi:MAG: hypothetical protein R3C03_02315 [Pirellulaceae bacterium]
MQKFLQLGTVWPCRSIEDFPTHYQGADASGLLVAWTSLWHPAFLNHLKTIPQWLPFDSDQLGNQELLLTLPDVSRRKLDQDAISVIRDAANYLESGNDRHRAVQSIASELGLESIDCVSRDLVDAFFALGYSWLQIQLMTRQLRYSSSLDMKEWNSKILEAAHNTVANNCDLARVSIQAAFDLLHEEKNRYYPVKADLFDLVLFTKSMLPISKPVDFPSRVQNWHLELDESTKINWTNDVLKGISDQIANGRLEIVGGVMPEVNQLMLSICETIEGIRRYQNTSKQLFGECPSTFMRRTSGLHPNLPMILSLMGYSGALHMPFLGERIPQASAPKFSWQGTAGSRIAALGATLLDASDNGSFLKLGVMIGEQIDSYHSASIVFAHWPSQFGDFFGDLLVASSYGGLFGTFRLFSEFFDEFYDSGYGDSFEFDDYRSRTLTESAHDDQYNSILFASQGNHEFATRLARERIATILEMIQAVKTPEDDLDGVTKQLAVLNGLTPSTKCQRTFIAQVRSRNSFSIRLRSRF